MKTQEKEKVVQTLRESTFKIKVGKFTFRISPLTLMQIYEMGVFANEIKEATWKEGEKINIIHNLIERNNDARLMCEVFIVCAFRKKWARKLWGSYIRRHLDITAFNMLVTFISSSFNANFFLTSIIFLTKTKIMTEPQTTPHGQSLEQ